MYAGKLKELLHYQLANLTNPYLSNPNPDPNPQFCRR